jgi:hypothetical protein
METWIKPGIIHSPNFSGLITGMNPGASPGNYKKNKKRNFSTNELF